ncbi:MAG: hypothetical protein CVV27_13320 [Candidatus Melainabacteria bacterium HGW-Melainabacteria-1]|nr:MAG: hypothetical protein CVV27_13320 [Candidatus Melainabacteria bacterium HGW-Melainabacteria-1]
MSKSIMGFLILVAIIGGLGGYAYYNYNRPAMNDPTHELSIPESAQKIRENTKEPLKKFEKQMGDRVDRAKERGVDLTKPQ